MHEKESVDVNENTKFMAFKQSRKQCSIFFRKISTRNKKPKNSEYQIWCLKMELKFTSHARRLNADVFYNEFLYFE